MIIVISVKTKQMCEDIKGTGPRNQLIFPLFQKQFWSECLKQPPGVSWELKGTFYFRTSWDNSFHPLGLPTPFSCVTGNWFEIKGFYEAVLHACQFVCFISGHKSWAGKFVSTLFVLVWVLLLFACLFSFWLTPRPCISMWLSFSWSWVLRVRESGFELAIFQSHGSSGKLNNSKFYPVPAPQKLTLI